MLGNILKWAGFPRITALPHGLQVPCSMGSNGPTISNAFVPFRELMQALDNFWIQVWYYGVKHQSYRVITVMLPPISQNAQRLISALTPHEVNHVNLIFLRLPYRTHQESFAPFRYRLCHVLTFWHMDFVDLPHPLMSCIISHLYIISLSSS